MSIITSSLLSILFAMPVAVLPQHPQPVPVSVSEQEWHPEAGDSIFVDTQDNFGVLVHPDGRYFSFPVLTGQRRRVYYIGRSYNAATPNRDWTAASIEIKGDRVTFGPSGRFLRLTDDGERTAYGFHEHRDESKMFSENTEERFRSMGCIIVEKRIMDILALTYDLNGTINVTTRHGIDDIGSLIVAAAKTARENL